MLNTLYDQAIIMCENSNHSVMILINLMKKDHWAPYIIYQVKCTKGIRGSSYLESNHSSVNLFVM